MIKFTVRSSGKTERSLEKMLRINYRSILEREARKGVTALAAATPKDSGLASSSWGYKVSGGRGGATITWTNNDIENGFPVAISLQLGYGTGTGGYVEGRDYINPAMKPVFDKIADAVWKVVTEA